MHHGFIAAGWLTEKVGVMKALQLGNIANTIFYASMGAARAGWHFYAACESRPSADTNAICNAIERAAVRALARRCLVHAVYVWELHLFCTGRHVHGRSYRGWRRPR